MQHCKISPLKHLKDMPSACLFLPLLSKIEHEKQNMQKKCRNNQVTRSERVRQIMGSELEEEGDGWGEEQINPDPTA